MKQAQIIESRSLTDQQLEMFQVFHPKLITFAGATYFCNLVPQERHSKLMGNEKYIAHEWYVWDTKKCFWAPEYVNAIPQEVRSIFSRGR